MLKNSVNRRLRRDASQSTALLWKGALSKFARTRLKLDCAWGPEGNERWILHSALFLRNPGTARCGSRIRLLPKACPRHVPTVYYRKICRQLLRPLRRAAFFCPNFQPHRLVSECIATKACTSSIQGNSIGLLKERSHTLLLGGSMHIFPCPQSFIG